MLKNMIRNALKKAIKVASKASPKLKKFVRDVKKAQKLTKNIEEMHKKEVKIGILAKDGTASKKGSKTQTLIAVATRQEFGLGVPERSFIRGYFVQEQAKIIEEAARLSKMILTGKIGPSQALKLLGVLAVGGIQQRISNQIPPPNAAATIKRKKSSTPLIDTGQLRTAIAYQIVKRKQ